MNRLFLYLTKIIYGKEVLDMLAMLYASLIVRGSLTIDDVPEALKTKVTKILDDVL